MWKLKDSGEARCRGKVIEKPVIVEKPVVRETPKTECEITFPLINCSLLY